MSFLVRHSDAPDAEETTTRRREPNRRDMIGPYFWERLCNERWMGDFMRWRWPMNGSDIGGLGGRFSMEFLVKKMNLRAKRRRRAERDVNKMV